ncbi:MAG: aldo/keto reductase family protein [Acidimicrobiales bacterium]|nr:aldo/keto reductase family protein [Acidimicrobiales bacterium]
MQHRHLGSSGLKVSALTYGNWITHGSQVDDDAALACVHAALDLGITTFDTADVYAGTEAEKVLGKALSGQRREGLEIATKVFWPTGPGVNDRGLSRKHIMESIEGSLRRLQVDYVDLYQAHRFDHETPVEETVAAFDDLIRQGKVLYVGVSEWRREEIKAYLDIADASHRSRLVSNQPQYSILWRVIESEVVPFCLDQGIGQIVWSPLAQGVLTGKYHLGEPPPAGSRATDPTGSNFLQGYLRDKVLEAIDRLRPVAKEAGLSMAVMSLAWVLSRPGISSAIVGATRPEQLEENVVAANVTLGQDVLEAIDEAVQDVAITDPAKTVSPPQRP